MPEHLAPIELVPLPIDEDELLARYERIFTAAVYDALIVDHQIFSVFIERGGAL